MVWGEKPAQANSRPRFYHRHCWYRFRPRLRVFLGNFAAFLTKDSTPPSSSSSSSDPRLPAPPIDGDDDASEDADGYKYIRHFSWNNEKKRRGWKTRVTLADRWIYRCRLVSPPATSTMDCRKRISSYLLYTFIFIPTGKSTDRKIIYRYLCSLLIISSPSKSSSDKLYLFLHNYPS